MAAAKPVGVAAPQSYDFGGYSVSPQGGPSKITATFTLPLSAPGCPTIKHGDSFQDINLGATLLSSGDTADSYADVNLPTGGNEQCGEYVLQADVGDVLQSEQVSPGDSISVTIQNVDGTVVATATDSTAGTDVTVSGPADTGATTFELGARANDPQELSGTSQNLPIFNGVINFTAAEVNGLYFNQVAPTPSPSTMHLYDSPSKIRAEALAPTSRLSSKMSIFEKHPEKIVPFECFYDPHGQCID